MGPAVLGVPGFITSASVIWCFLCMSVFPRHALLRLSTAVLAETPITWDFGPTLTQHDLVITELIITAETLFPNMGTCRGT